MLNGAADRLKSIIERMYAPLLTCLGNSMGATGAIFYGHILHADKVMAFWERLHTFGDRRFGRHIQNFNDVYDDVPYVPEFCERHPHSPDIHIYYSTQIANNEYIHIDALHAEMMRAVPRCTLHALSDDCGHNIAHHLKKTGRFPELVY